MPLDLSCIIPAGVTPSARAVRRPGARSRASCHASRKRPPAVLSAKKGAPFPFQPSASVAYVGNGARMSWPYTYLLSDILSVFASVSDMTTMPDLCARLLACLPGFSERWFSGKILEVQRSKKRLAEARKNKRKQAGAITYLLPNWTNIRRNSGKIHKKTQHLRLPDI